MKSEASAPRTFIQNTCFVVFSTTIIRDMIGYLHLYTFLRLPKVSESLIIAAADPSKHGSTQAQAIYQEY